MRKPYKMQPPGIISSRARPIRVSSSTTPSKAASADAHIGLVDFSDPNISAADKFMASQVENGNYSNDVYNYFQ